MNRQLLLQGLQLAKFISNKNNDAMNLGKIYQINLQSILLILIFLIFNRFGSSFGFVNICYIQESMGRMKFEYLIQIKYFSWEFGIAISKKVNFQIDVQFQFKDAFFKNIFPSFQLQESEIQHHMLRLIKFQSSLLNIKLNSGFNFYQLNQLPQAYLHRKTPANSSNHSHKQNPNKSLYCQKYHFSTSFKKPTNLSKMQPQIKPILQSKPTQENTQQKQLIEPLTQDNPFSTYDQDLFEDLVKYEKTNIGSEQYRSRGIKRKEKLQKIRSELKDIQVRRQRNRQRHRKQKQKLQKNLENLKQEEIKPFLAQRKLLKQQLKDRIKQDVEKQIGQPFLIDIAFEHRMNQKQNKSLAIQIQLIVKALRQIDPSPNVHLCGLKEGLVKTQLMKNKFQYWPIKSYDQPLGECLNMQKFKDKKIYYLSPDAPKTLDTIEPNSIFIIGGLVDRTVIKYASLNRAQELKVEARSLLIRPFMKQRSCLNLDHIVMIVCKYMEVKDWKQAFDYGAPKRWKCGEGQKGLKQIPQLDLDD